MSCPTESVTCPRPTDAPTAGSARLKDTAIAALILAGAASAWFSWGFAGERFAAALGIGMWAAIGTLIAGVVCVRRTPGAPTMATDPQVRRTYWRAVVAEVVAIVAGAFVLNRVGHPEYLPAWTLAVVGLHFLPLARAFGMPLLRWVAAAATLVATAALVSGLAGWLPAPTVAGLGGGLVLLAGALVSLAAVTRRER